MKKIKLNYLWTIENFSLHNVEVGEYIESPIFSSPKKNNTFKWNLRMYPNEKDSDGIAIFLMCLAGSLPPLEVSWEISALNTSRGKQKTVTGENLFRGTIVHGTFGFLKKAYVLDEKNGAMKNDIINVLAKISFYLQSTKSISGDCNLRGKSDLEDQFSDHFEPLLESGNYGDAVLMVRSQQFHVHKAILCARSSVFSALFVNGWKIPWCRRSTSTQTSWRRRCATFTPAGCKISSQYRTNYWAWPVCTRSTACRRHSRRACARASASITWWTFSALPSAVRPITSRRRSLGSLLRTPPNSLIYGWIQEVRELASGRYCRGVQSHGKGRSKITGDFQYIFSNINLGEKIWAKRFLWHFSSTFYIFLCGHK